ncbi:MAG: DUF2254 family protein [Halanaerobium sp.]|nr:DUF2254 family protein [Halanaerobium sp.]
MLSSACCSLKIVLLRLPLSSHQSSESFSPWSAWPTSYVSLHHVANSIQVNILVEALSKEVIEIVDRIKRRNDENENIRSEPPADLDELVAEEGREVLASKRGYIQFVHDLALCKFADEHSLIIRAEKTIGDYVTVSSKLFSIYGATEEFDPGQLDHYVVIGKERSSQNDIEFGILKLTEVALKAISPSINDPNTAIFCIMQMGMLLSRIASADLENTYYYNDEEQLTLIFEDVSFKELLYKTFYQLRYYSSHEISVAGSILDSLNVIAEGNDLETRELVWDFSGYIIDGFDQGVLQEMDKKFLNKKIGKLALVTGNKVKKDRLFQ